MSTQALHAESEVKAGSPASKAHVAPAKKEVVKELEALCRKYSIVGVVNMQNLPAKQLQRMREVMRGQVQIRMAKRRLIKICLTNVDADAKSGKQGIAELNSHYHGMPALLFTNENPFSLFQTLKKNKSKAPIKGGQTAPNDIVVKAGPTDFAPGPIIGELGGFGIQTGVESGKVAIRADRVVAKEGSVVSAKLAGLLTRLGVEPMEIGLDLVAVFEDGKIVTKQVLDIEPEEYKKNITLAASESFNLAMSMGYACQDTIVPLLVKAVREARGLAYSQDILADEIVPDLLLKAYNQALSVAGCLPDGVRPAEASVVSGDSGHSSGSDEKHHSEPPAKKDDDGNAGAAGLASLFG